MRKPRQRFLADPQMIPHQLRRQMRQPVRQRHILVAIGFEQLQKHQVPVPGVLDVVRKILLHVPHIALPKVHRARPRSGRKHRHPPLALHVVLPLIGIRMPVHLPQSARMQNHVRSSDLL